MGRRFFIFAVLLSATAFAVPFSTPINDYLDRNISNRINTRAGDVYSFFTPDTDPDANAFGDGQGNSFVNARWNSTYRINGTVHTLTNPIFGSVFIERQHFWIRGAAYYSEGTTDNFVADFSSDGVLGWSAKFANSTNDAYGIPVCGRMNNQNNDYTNCSFSDRMDRSRMLVNFLGDSDWRIIEMQAPIQPLPSATGIVRGGEIKIGKESSYAIINFNESMPAGNGITLRLADVASNQPHPAIIDIIGQDGDVIRQVQIDPGVTQVETINGIDYLIHVYQTAPGFNPPAEWAEVAVLSKELRLIDGEQVDNGTSSNSYVLLKWKNRGWFQSDEPAVNRADSLRELVIYDNETYASQSDALRPTNRYHRLLGTYSKFYLRFAGLDLASYDSLTGDIVDSATVLQMCGNQNITVPSFIRVRSSTPSAFRIQGFYGNEVVYTTSDGEDTGFGVIYLKLSPPDNCYIVRGNYDTNVAYITAGPGNPWYPNDGGILRLWGADQPYSNALVTITLFEDIGEVGWGGIHHAATLQFSARNSTNYSSEGHFRFIPINGGEGTVMYWSPANMAPVPQTGEHEEGYRTERGTQFVSVSATGFQLNVARSIGRLKFDFTDRPAVQRPMPVPVISSVGGEETGGSEAQSTSGATSPVPKERSAGVLNALGIGISFDIFDKLFGKK